MNDWSVLDAWLGSQPGDYGIYVCTLAGRTVYSYRADVVRPAASLIKVAIALTLDHYARAGTIRLVDTVKLTEAARTEGDGPVDNAPAGSSWSYATLVEHMLRESDNTASNLLIDLLEQRGLGMAAVNVRLRELGVSNSCLQRRFMDYAAARAGRDNLMTAHDIAQLFVHLATSNQPSTHALLDPMHNTIVHEKILAGVPPSIRVAHKPGDLPGVEHDAGIVYAPRSPYIVALMGNALPDPATGQHTLAVASRMIYQQMTEGDQHGA